MNIRERIAKVIAPGMVTKEAVQELVKDEVARMKVALPITANYDPKNEGYRRLMGENQHRRDLYALTQDRMFEVAYFMWDNSAMTRGLATMDKAFLFAEPITVTADDEDVQEIITDFWEDPENNMDIELPDQMMWLSLLGEQVWPASVNARNGHVRLGYYDPAQVKEVYVNPRNIKQVQMVEMLGRSGHSGEKLTVIRRETDPRKKEYEKLVGNCFYFTVNRPPNSPRGRSDFLTLFDWIDGLERYSFNHLERAEFMLNYIWDVLLEGMDEQQIREWLRNNQAPEPGSVRAHNERVTWQAVAPDIKSHDVSKGYEMGKSFIMGAARRPESWFGGGGKAYQTEAEQFGQVPIKDLDQRQLYIKHIVKHVVQFVLDQAVIAGRLSEEKAETGFSVNMPEISKKDLGKVTNAVPQLATALSIAEDRWWVTREDAVKIFGMVMGQLGVEVDAEAALKEAEKKREDEGEEGTEDYM